MGIVQVDSWWLLAAFLFLGPVVMISRNTFAGSVSLRQFRIVVFTAIYWASIPYLRAGDTPSNQKLHYTRERVSDYIGLQSRRILPLQNTFTYLSTDAKRVNRSGQSAPTSVTDEFSDIEISVRDWKTIALNLQSDYRGRYIFYDQRFILPKLAVDVLRGDIQHYIAKPDLLKIPTAVPTALDSSWFERVVGKAKAFFKGAAKTMTYIDIAEEAYGAYLDVDRAKTFLFNLDSKGEYFSCLIIDPENAKEIKEAFVYQNNSTVDPQWVPLWLASYSLSSPDAALKAKRWLP